MIQFIQIYKCKLTPKLILAGLLILANFNFILAQNIWNGAVNTDWNNSNNWTLGSVPSINDNVQINSGYINVPTLNSNVTISGLRISNQINGVTSTVGISIINVNDFKLTVGYIKSPTSATGLFFLENFDIAGGPGQVNFILSCSGACAGAFIVNGSVTGLKIEDKMNSKVDVAFNFYNNVGIPTFRIQKLDKNFTVAGIATNDPCNVFSGFNYDAQGFSMSPYNGISYLNWNLGDGLCTILGNMVVINRTDKVLRLGWFGLDLRNNLYLSNTGGGALRLSEVTGQSIIRVAANKQIAIVPSETLPQNGVISIQTINQMGGASGFNIDLTTCPGGCSTAPSGNIMLNLAGNTFTGPVFIKTPSINISPIRDPNATYSYTNGYDNNYFYKSFDLIKTGSQNDYLAGGNIFYDVVNVTNTGTGSINFSTPTTKSTVCGISLCGGACQNAVLGDISYYDAQMPGDQYLGNINIVQACGAGFINLVNSATNAATITGELLMRLSQNTTITGGLKFIGTSTVGQYFKVVDNCNTNPIVAVGTVQPALTNGGNLILDYQSGLANHKKLFVFDQATVFTSGKINTKDVKVQLNGNPNAHIGNNANYFIVNTLGGVSRNVTTSAVPINFSVGTSSKYYPVNFQNASANAQVIVQMRDGVNFGYSNFTSVGINIPDKFINAVWLISSTVVGLKSEIQGGWDNSATITGFAPATSARMARNNGTSWDCVGLSGAAIGGNPSFVPNFSTQNTSTIPGIYSVLSDNISVGANQTICGVFNTSAVLASTSFAGGTWTGLSFPVPISILGANTNSPTVLGLNVDGVYTLRWTSTSYCGASDFRNVLITKIGSTNIPKLTYSGAVPYCNIGSTSPTIIPSSLSGGTFSTTTAGLSLSAGTGVIALNASATNNYTINYTISIVGCGISTTSVGITINSVSGVSLSYTGTPYCNSGIASVTTNTGGGYFTTSASVLGLNTSNGAINLASSPTGAFAVTYNLSVAGCPLSTATSTITINSVPGISLNYAGTPYCSTGGVAIVTTNTGGGYFTTSASGLGLNTANGAITLTSSPTGTFAVNYNLSVAGCPLSTATSTITINSVPAVNFNYVSPVCNTVSNRNPTAVNTVIGGVFSSSSGLIINSISGIVSPNLSLANTYTINYNYTIAGCGPQSTTTSLVVTSLPNTPVFSYGTTPYCSSSPISLISAANTINGSFLTTATGFSVNNIGQISIPQNTTAGIYVIRYEIPANAGCASVMGMNILTLSGVPSPLTILGPPNTNQCYASSFVLTATGTIPNSTISWIENNSLVGSNSPNYNTSILTNTPNTFVAIINNGVCATVPSANFVINMHANPTVAGLTADKSFACKSQSVSLSNISTFSTGYAINTGAGFNFIPNNNYTFNNTIVGDAFSFVGYSFVAGCQTVTSNVIIVNSSVCGLTAAFNPSITVLCLDTATGTGVTFTNNSTTAGGSITGYYWDFGADATPNTTLVGYNPTNYTINVKYSTSGSKNIFLSILGTGGITSTTNSNIQIDALTTLTNISIPINPVCELSTPMSLSVLGSSPLQWYKNNVAQGTAFTQSTGVLALNTTFDVTAKNGVCPMLTTTSVVTIVNKAIGGIIAGSTAICASSAGLNLSITGLIGDGYSWYSSIDAGANWIIKSSNNPILPTGILSTTTSYIVSVTSGICPMTASGITVVNVTQTPTVGAASSDRMIICTIDGNGGIYSVSGFAGTLIWQQSLDQNTWNTAAGANGGSSVFSATNAFALGTHYFRAKVTNSAACGDVYTNIVTVTSSTCALKALFTPTNQTICVNVGNTIQFTDNSTSTNSISGWSWDFGPGVSSSRIISYGAGNAGNTPSATFTMVGANTVTLSIVGTGGVTSIYSTTITVTGINTISGITGNQQICEGSVSNMSVLANISALQWYSSLDGNTYSLIGNATNNTYSTPNSLTGGNNYFYKAVSSGGVCTTVVSLFAVSVTSPINTGTITGLASICKGENATLTATGMNGSILWEKSFGNFSTSTLTGVTASTYQENNIPQTIYYRLNVTRGSCGTSISGIFALNVNICRLTPDFSTVNFIKEYCLEIASTTGIGFIDNSTTDATITGRNWDFGANANPRTFSGNQNPSGIKYSLAGTKTVSLTVTGTGGVTTTTSINITVLDYPRILNFNALKLNICEGDTARLSVSIVGGNVSWFAKTSTTPYISLNNTSTGIKTVPLIQTTYLVTSSNNICPLVTSTSINISTTKPPSAIITGSDTVCQGVQAEFYLTPGADNISKVIWQKLVNNLIVSNDSISSNFGYKAKLFTGSATFRANIIGIAGCINNAINSNSINVSLVDGSLGGNAVAKDIELCELTNSQITLTGFRGNISWVAATDSIFTPIRTVDDSNNPTVNSPIYVTPYQFDAGSILYYKALVQRGNCPAIASNIVKIKVCDNSDFIPNALTPNSFDDNSTWDLFRLKLRDDASVVIYNRLGSQLLSFSGKDLKANPWNGSELPAGTYYYVMDRRDSKLPRTGAITIIK